MPRGTSRNGASFACGVLASQRLTLSAGEQSVTEEEAGKVAEALYLEIGLRSFSSGNFGQRLYGMDCIKEVRTWPALRKYAEF